MCRAVPAGRVWPPSVLRGPGPCPWPVSMSSPQRGLRAPCRVKLNLGGCPGPLGLFAHNSAVSWAGRCPFVNYVLAINCRQRAPQPLAPLEGRGPHRPPQPSGQRNSLPTHGMGPLQGPSPPGRNRTVSRELPSSPRLHCPFLPYQYAFLYKTHTHSHPGCDKDLVISWGLRLALL